MNRLLIVLGLSLLSAPQTVAAADADEKLLHGLGLKSDGQALLDYLTRQVENRARLQDLIQDLGDRRFAVREKATADLIGLGHPAVQALEMAAASPDPEIARRARHCLAQIPVQPPVLPAVLRLLGDRKPPGAARVLLAYLPNVEEQSREAVGATLAALAVREGKSDPALVAALADREPLKRGLAAETLIRAKALDQRAAVRKLLTDPDAAVRLKVALALLTQARDKDAVPVLIDLLAAPPTGQGWKVEAVLLQLADKGAPARPAPENPRAYRAAWAAWWQQHGQRLGLARLDFHFYPPGDRVLKGHQAEVYRLALSPDGRLLASASQDRTVRLWDIGTGTEVRRFQGHRDGVDCVAYSPKGELLASGSADSTIRLWDAATGKELRQLQGHQGEVYGVAFSPDAQTLASGGKDKTVRLWDVATGKELRQFLGHSDEVGAVVFSPDGRRLASGSSDLTARLWDVVTGKEVQKLGGHESYVHAVAISPDGRTLVSASCDHTLRLWDLATGRRLHHLRGHRKCVRSVSFAPDGRTFASGSVDNTIRLWDAATGKEVRLLQGHDRQVDSLVFSPDGRRLASASRDTTIRIWDLTLARTVVAPPAPETAEDLEGRNGQSFVFEVVGRNDGDVWGTDQYTDDSEIATAAVHAGLVKVGEKGLVKLTLLPGQKRYTGSTRHGVASDDYEEWERSYKLEAAKK